MSCRGTGGKADFFFERRGTSLERATTTEDFSVDFDRYEDWLGRRRPRTLQCAFTPDFGPHSCPRDMYEPIEVILGGQQQEKGGEHLSEYEAPRGKREGSYCAAGQARSLKAAIRKNGRI